MQHNSRWLLLYDADRANGAQINRTIRANTSPELLNFCFVRDQTLLVISS